MDCMTCLAVQKTKYELFDEDYILMNNSGLKKKLNESYEVHKRLSEMAGAFFYKILESLMVQ